MCSVTLPLVTAELRKRSGPMAEAVKPFNIRDWPREGLTLEHAIEHAIRQVVSIEMITCFLIFRRLLSENARQQLLKVLQSGMRGIKCF
jgi:hypothetical protein